MSARAPGRALARSFTMAEVLLSSLVVATMLVAAMRTLAAGAQSRQARARAVIAGALAQHLLSEVQQRRFAEACDAPVFGREAGEDSASRAAWDDCDDYNGLSESPPRRWDGSEIAGFSGWSRAVRVEYVGALAQNLVLAGMSSTQKRIVVTVTDPAGRQTVATGVRADRGIADLSQDRSVQRLGWVGFEVQAGSNGPVLVSGAEAWNRPAVPAGGGP